MLALASEYTKIKRRHTYQGKIEQDNKGLGNSLQVFKSHIDSLQEENHRKEGRHTCVEIASSVYPATTNRGAPISPPPSASGSVYSHRLHYSVPLLLPTVVGMQLCTPPSCLLRLFLTPRHTAISGHSVILSLHTQHPLSNYPGVSDGLSSYVMSLSIS